MIRVFLDCDGVLADFDARAMEILDGRRPRDFEDDEGAEALWEKLYTYPDFFYSLPVMPDALDLVRGVEALGFHPTVLTGIPKPRGGPGAVNAAADKRRWVAKNIGEKYQVITCRSKDKVKNIEKFGDVLVDDWHKYKHLWEEKGLFILHTSAEQSLKELEEYKWKIHEILEAHVK